MEKYGKKDMTTFIGIAGFGLILLVASLVVGIKFKIVGIIIDLVKIMGILFFGFGLINIIMILKNGDKGDE